MIVARKIQNAARAVERKKIKTYCDTERHERDNRIAAEAILADPVKYDGAMLQWAKAFMARVSK